jgi:hypothetical protein
MENGVVPAIYVDDKEGLKILLLDEHPGHSEVKTHRSEDPVS